MAPPASVSIPRLGIMERPQHSRKIGVRLVAVVLMTTTELEAISLLIGEATGHVQPDKLHRSIEGNCSRCCPLSAMERGLIDRGCRLCHTYLLPTSPAFSNARSGGINLQHSVALVYRVDQSYYPTAGLASRQNVRYTLTPGHALHRKRS